MHHFVCTSAPTVFFFNIYIFDPRGFNIMHTYSKNNEIKMVDRKEREGGYSFSFTVGKKKLLFQQNNEACFRQKGPCIIYIPFLIVLAKCLNTFV